jgi:hypothetical protein
VEPGTAICEVDLTSLEGALGAVPSDHAHALDDGCDLAESAARVHEHRPADGAGDSGEALDAAESAPNGLDDQAWQPRACLSPDEARALPLHFRQVARVDDQVAHAIVIDEEVGAIPEDAQIRVIRDTRAKLLDGGRLGEVVRPPSDTEPRRDRRPLDGVRAQIRNCRWHRAPPLRR